MITLNVPIYTWVKNVADFCSALSKYLCILTLIVITVVMFIEVILRYFFNAPLMWAESLVKVCLIVVSFLGAGMALYRRGHMSISLIFDRFPLKMRCVMQLIFDVIILTFFVLFTIFGYQAAVNIPGFLWEFGNLRKMWLFMILPFSGIIISIQALYLVLEDIFEPKIKS